MIKVYQIVLSNFEIYTLNKEGWECPDPKIRAYGRLSFVKPEDVDMQFYTHVANVQTSDQEEAFMLMNLWEKPELVEKLSPTRSMSVGDVLEMEDGTFYLCASFGFEPLS